MKVEVLEDSGILESGIKYKKETVFVADEPHEIVMAKRWVKNGWAKDLETGEIGERVEGVAKIAPDTAKLDLKKKSK